MGMAPTIPTTAIKSPDSILPIYFNLMRTEERVGRTDMMMTALLYFVLTDPPTKALASLVIYHNLPAMNVTS